MNKKSFFIFSAIIFAVSFLYFLSNHYQSDPEQWQTYNKVNGGKVKSYPTTAKEIEKYQLPNLKGEKKARSPASSPIVKSKKRTVINPANKKITPNMLASNKVTREWKEKLGQNLLRFLRPETLLFLKKEQSISIVERGQIRHAEVVLIQLKDAEGRRFSYNAYVDSESGQVLQTWNRTIHESYEKKPMKLTPSGTINNAGTTRF